MFYEYICDKCGHLFLIKMPMYEASLTDMKLCPVKNCHSLGHRAISLPSIHMNEWVAEGYRRTNEPPEENKPGIKKLQEERAGGDIVSYPGAAAHRERGLQ